MSAWAIAGARSAVVITVLTVLGCSSATRARGSSSPLDAAVTPSPAYSRSTLTRVDLAATNAETIIEAIARLRPEFLLGHSRPPAFGRAQIALYVNDTYEGDISLLNTIPLSVIREVALLQPTEAQFRFGITCRCPGGVILVNTRLRPSERQ
jgi:hypothetical protein